MLNRIHLLLVCLFLCWFGQIAIQPIRAQSPEPAPVIKDEPKEDKERTIYIPYSRLREVFEKEGRGVFLPYEKFKALWEAAHKAPATPPPVVSPHDALIVDVENNATVQGDAFVVQATLKIELIKTGWLKLPLRLNDTAILSAKIDGEPARVVTDTQGGYQLLIHNPPVEGKEFTSKVVQLDLEYAKSFTKSPGLNSIQLQPPQAPINRWTVTIPEPDTKIQVQPMLASTQVDQNEAAKDEEPNKESTVVQAFVGATSQLQIDWTPKSEGASGMDAVVTVQVNQTATIEEGLQRTRANLIYSISRSELATLQIKLQKDHKVINVFDTNIRKWSIEEKDDHQLLTVELFEPARKTQNVIVDLERYNDINAKSNQMDVVQIEALKVARQQGTIHVRTTMTDIRVEPISQRGLLQVDSGETPNNNVANAKAAAPATSKSSLLSFRYASLPYQLTLNVSKVQSQLNVEQLSEVYLDQNQIQMDVHFAFEIKNAGVFQFLFDVPTDYKLVNVRGTQGKGTEVAAIDNYQFTSDAKPALQVNLSKKAVGKVGLVIQLQKTIEDGKALSETGKQTTIHLELPQSKDASVVRSSGHVIVYAPESIRVNISDRGSSRDVPISLATTSAPSTRENKLPDLKDVLSLEHANGPVLLTLQAERRKPSVSVRQLLSARVEPGIVSFNSRFFYDVKYSGIPFLRIDVPNDVSDKLRLTTPSVRESILDPQPDDVAEGYKAWSFQRDQEWIGPNQIELTWESELDDLEIGKSLDIDIPRLVPKSVDRQWGQILLSKAESLDIQTNENVNGVRPIDPQVDLFQEASGTDVVRAFEFQDNWSLAISSTRYALEEVKRTSIERALIRMVLTRSNQTTVVAMYRIRSARQRLAIDLPPNAEFDSQPLRINGQPPHWKG